MSVVAQIVPRVVVHLSLGKYNYFDIQPRVYLLFYD